MKGKTSKRISAIILTLAMMLGTMVAYGQHPYYPPGDVIYTMEDKYCTEKQNVELNNGVITVENGGKIVYDYYITQDSNNMIISYEEASGASMIVKPEGSVAAGYQLKEGGGSITYTFPVAQRRGDNVLEIEFKGSVKITSIVFNAKTRPQYTAWWADPERKVFADLTDEQDAISSAVIIKTNSPVLLWNGANRYVNDDDRYELPTEINGSIYLPIKTISRSFGYYYEEMTDKDYCMIRREQLTFKYKDGVMTKQIGHGEPEVITILPVLKNGHYYLPIRYFAEALGETVLYKDGIIVVDGKHRSNDIVSSTTVMGYITNTLGAFVGDSIVGTTYHVAQTYNASDDNPGTVEAPFLTLAKAGKTAKAGDTVIVHEGVYREVLVPENSGAEKAPITYKAAEGESATISATEPLNGISDMGDGTVAAKVNWDLGVGRNQIFYNGECIVEARYPNDPRIPMSELGEELSDLFPIRGDFFVPDDNKYIATSQTLLNQEEKDYWKDAIFVSLHGAGWTLSTAEIVGSEKGVIYLDNLAEKWWFEPEKQDKADWGYISGGINCMDLPGEWVIKNGVMLMIPPEGETADTLQLEMKKRQKVIDLDGKSNIIIEGIKTFGGTITMHDSNMCTLDNMDIRYTSHYTWCDNQRDGFINDGTMAELKQNPMGSLQAGEVGIYIGGYNNRVTDCRIDHSAAGGLILAGAYLYIDNNIVSNCGYMGAYISGITMTDQPDKPQNEPCGGHGIYNNTVYNCGRSLWNAQHLEGYWGGGYSSFMPYELAYNDFHDGVLFSLDTGLAYEYTTINDDPHKQTEEHNNYMYVTVPETNPYSLGLYHDGGTAGMNTFENIIFTTEENVIFTSTYVYSDVTSSPNQMWNNKGLQNDRVPGGPKNLKVNQYPYGLPFYAGSTLDAEPYMLNYEDAAQDFNYYHASEAILGGGAKVSENGDVLFTEKGNYIEIKDVDFGEEGVNMVDYYFRGDKYEDTFTIEFGWGASIETADFWDVELRPTSPETYQISQVTDYFMVIGGKGNMYVRSKTPVDFALVGIVPNKTAYEDKKHDGTRVFGGDFNRVDRIGGGIKAKTAKTYTDYFVAKDVWSGTILRYSKVQIPENANVLYVATGVKGKYAGQDVVFSYTTPGAPANTFIGKVRTVDNGWETEDDFVYVELEKPIPAGEVDIYVSFEGEAGKTCNLYTFGFLPEIPKN